MFGYVVGNPSNNIDPDGLEKINIGIGGSIPFIGGIDLNIFVTDGEGDLGCNPDIGISFGISVPAGGNVFENGIGKLKLGTQLGYDWDGGRGDFVAVDAEVVVGGLGVGAALTGVNTENYGVQVEGGVVVAAGANKTVDISVSIGDLGRLAAAIISLNFDHQIFGVPKGSDCTCKN